MDKETGLRCNQKKGHPLIIWKKVRYSFSTSNTKNENECVFCDNPAEFCRDCAMEDH